MVLVVVVGGAGKGSDGGGANYDNVIVLVGKLGEGSETRFDQDPLLGENSKCCSCCNEQLVLKGYDQRLVITKSIGVRSKKGRVNSVSGNKSLGGSRAEMLLEWKERLKMETHNKPCYIYIYIY